MNASKCTCSGVFCLVHITKCFSFADIQTQVVYKMLAQKSVIFHVITSSYLPLSTWSVSEVRCGVVLTNWKV